MCNKLSDSVNFGWLNGMYLVVWFVYPDVWHWLHLVLGDSECQDWMSLSCRGCRVYAPFLNATSRVDIWTSV